MNVVIWQDLFLLKWEQRLLQLSLPRGPQPGDCLLYTTDAADEEDSVDHGGRRIIK